VIKIYDTIIIGTGPAGYSAAVYNARFKLNTLVLGKRYGGLIQDTHLIENWPGIKSISGSDLAKQLKEHAESYKEIEFKEQEVIDVKKQDKTFRVKTKDNEYETKTIIFATGTERRKLNVPGAKDFENKGVSYCALCDGPLFKDKTIAVVGGSDSAVKEALLLTEHAEKVYIIYRKDKLRAEPINVQRVLDNPKITIIYNTNIIQIKGEAMAKSVILDNDFKGNNELQLDGVFIEIGQIPGSYLAKRLGVELNKKTEIIIDKESKTNVDGVYAAGDVTDTKFKQGIMAAAQGATASFSAFNFIRK